MFLKRRSGLLSSRRIKAQRRLRAIRLALVLFICILLGGSFIWLSRQPHVQISNVIIEGVVSLTEENVQKEIESELKGYTWFVFPNRNIFFHPKEAIKDRVLNAFPEISDVTLKRRGFRALTAEVQERAPIALWCGEHEQISFIAHDEPLCYFLDESGVIFQYAPRPSTTSFFEFYSAKPETKIRRGSLREEPLGMQFLPKDDFPKLMDFKEALERLGIHPRKLVISSEDNYEFILENDIRIIFSPHNDFQLLLGNINAALQTSAVTREDLADKTPDLQYLDLRFQKKVYYKFR